MLCCPLLVMCQIGGCCDRIVEQLMPTDMDALDAQMDAEEGPGPGPGATEQQPQYVPLGTEAVAGTDGLANTN